MIYIIISFDFEPGNIVNELLIVCQNVLTAVNPCKLEYICMVFAS